MKLENELRKLKKYIGKPGTEFDKQLQKVKENFTSKKDIEQIDKFIKEGLSGLTADLKQFNNELSVREQLKDVSQIVSMSYIAEMYFNKKSQWLYQRINGNTVNGKPASFKQEEIKTLNKAFKDISKKIGSVVVS
ncbi:MAG: DUF5053 domain-containing protein [Chitinophagaceae bacterium]|nr:DUF5053 domain-containing protein [Chitinophagaceae bacterium]